MHVIRDISEYPGALKGATLAVGNFDGVHRGHQAVLSAAMEASNTEGANSGVMTFEPHPRQFFQPERPLFRLTPEPLKLKLFRTLGLDVAVVLTFDVALASRPARNFVEDILVGALGVSHVVTGSDFQFGTRRDGNPDVMRALGAEFGFDVTIVAPEGEGGDVFSSTQVRDCLRAGDPRGAARILGYWWRVSGEVIGGDKRGAGLGFPTANIAVPEGFGLKHGIYAVRAHAKNKEGTYDGAAYFGTRPSFDDGDPVIEVFLFDFSGDLYGQELELEIIDFLRGDEGFADPQALIAQMKADCDNAKSVLAQLKNNDPLDGFTLAQALG